MFTQKKNDEEKCQWQIFDRRRGDPCRRIRSFAIQMKILIISHLLRI